MYVGISFNYQNFLLTLSLIIDEPPVFLLFTLGVFIDRVYAYGIFLDLFAEEDEKWLFSSLD